MRFRIAVRPLVLLADQAVEANRPAAGHKQIEKDEAIHHGQFAAVLNRNISIRKMGFEVGHRHLAREEERHGDCKESENQKESSKTLQHAGQPEQREQVSLSVPSKQSKKLLKSVLRKSAAHNESQQ